MRRALVIMCLVALSACGSEDGGTESTDDSSTTTTSEPSTTTTSRPTTTTTAAPRVGESQTSSSSEGGRYTVYGIEFPVQGTDNAERIQTAGTEFAVVDFEACPAVTAEIAPDWGLVTSDNRTFEWWNVQIGARDPKFEIFQAIPGGSCQRGWITFELPPGSQIAEFRYAPETGSPLVWKAA